MMQGRLSLALVCLIVAGSASLARAERLGYPPEEFIARRQALAARLQEGLVLLLGKTLPTVATRFHQDNDFYYLTGNEDLNAVLIMDAATAEAHLFLPRQAEREIRADGVNWLADADGQARRWGFATIQPLDMASEFLARRIGSGGARKLWVRLSEADEVDTSRTTALVHLARRMKNPFGVSPSDQARQVDLLRRNFPAIDLQDLTPAIDRQRQIKTPREITVLRESGRIAAGAIVKAIEATRAGRFEYELEAEAVYHHVKHGAQIAGYPAIVGSGPNGLVWHYNDNGRRLQAGETIVMDFGPALDYQVIDITRTWPVSGRFDDDQLRAYRCVLEAQTAVIAAMRPGATRKQTREIAEAVFKKHGFDPRYASGAGHFVGMSVHDVGDYALPFEPGMVIAVEPILEVAERNLHVRIEDTVLITGGEPEILTAMAPKEVDALLALVPKAPPSSQAK
jgi:Xaa-Pro aminopeptidase